MTETPKLLPLGSAVTVDDHDGTYIIVARGFQNSPDGFVAGYKGVLHPVGAGGGAREIVIRQSAITELLHQGYASEADELFAKNQLENAATPPAAVPAPTEPELTIDLTKPAVDATVSSPSAAPVGEVTRVADPNDPFSGLRSKGKRR